VHRLGEPVREQGSASPRGDEVYPRMWVGVTGFSLNPTLAVYVRRKLT
jgi:hypothetical protein